MPALASGRFPGSRAETQFFAAQSTTRQPSMRFKSYTLSVVAYIRTQTSRDVLKIRVIS